MQTKKIIPCLALVMGTIFLAGCGANPGETIMEKAVESQTGGKVDINADENRMDIKSKEGEFSLSGNGNAKLHQEFPKDIYIADDAKILLSMANGQDGTYSAAYVTDQPADEIYTKYKTDLTANSWSADAQTEMVFGDSKTILYKNGTKRLTVIVGKSQDEQFKGKTHVQVIGATDKTNGQ